MKKNIVIILIVSAAIYASIAMTTRLTDKMAYDTLTERSEASARTWVSHFSSQIGGFSEIILNEAATDEQVRVLNDAQRFVDVFRFKIFDAEGYLILLSDNVNDANATFLIDDETNETALDVIQTGIQVTKINDGRALENRPNWYAETYFPLIDDGTVIGVAEVYVDVSDAHQTIFDAFRSLLKSLVFILLLSALVPIAIILWFIRHLQLSNLRLEEARLAATSAAKAKSSFLANMSHEIRTPMNGVVGMAALLSETDLTKEQKSLTDTITQSARALLVIINDVLDFSKIDSGHIRISKNSFNIHTCVQDAAVLLAPAAEGKNLELCVDIGDNVPIWVEGDDARLRQCLLNLIGNAVKFTPSGYVEIKVAIDGSDNILFSVKDTGIGIPPDKVDKVFADFEQVESSETREIEGTGLGLAITRKLISLMGGEIKFESEPDVGTEFFFSLPLAAIEPPISESCTETVDLTGKHALVVDDLEVNRRILTERLESLGMTSQAANSYGGALDIISKRPADKPFDIAILDHHMPIRSGVDLAEAIRKDASTSSLPIIFLSSGNLEDLKGRADQLGISILVNKPIKTTDLVDAINTATTHAISPPEAGNLLSKEIDAAQHFKLRVAVAEDNVINRMLMEKMVGPLVDEIVFWENGQIAVSSIDQWSPDIVFMDVSMPVLDGLSATRAIREQERQHGKPKTPIIALTANAMAEDREKCLAAGMTGYLSKPVQKAEFIDLLAAHSNLDSG
ncbi:MULTISPECIES: hybrid sensor histidine kinase/response regulator [Rhodobacterales]|uniref:hybrid sensor histidine kinase/response regulator n=1 Tax=Rhodobacterales TaxID=204455 RepID=UPI0015F0354B|nr:MULTISPECIES: response regulator [Rhodobacterales]MDO6589452.1 response regulator [Yoonia sp. 1_MG-2023]